MNWNYQVQHVFFDHIGRCSNVLIIEESEGRERAQRFHEFDLLLSAKDGIASLAPFSTILDGMHP